MMGHNAAAATLDPTPATVIAGQSITLTLNDTISGSSAIGGIDLQVTFNQSLLSLVSVADGSLLIGWDAPTFNPSSDPNTSLISISENNGDDPNGMGSVLTLTFAATATDPTGITSVTIKTVPQAVGAAGEYQLALLTKQIKITAASVTPPITVPEPTSAMLLLVPMLAAAGLTRRNRC